MKISRDLEYSETVFKVQRKEISLIYYMNKYKEIINSSMNTH